MKTISTLIMLFLNVANILFAQDSAFDLFNTSRFARTIRLGNAYTGVAEGPEALFYNTAGIADEKLYSLTISSGQGLGLFVDDLKSFDYALIVPLIGNSGTIGLSINSLSYRFSDINIKRTENNIYSLNYAKKLTDSFSAGITFSYYYTEIPNNLAGTSGNSISGTSFDITLSSLYKLNNYFKISANDSFNAGLQIKNILNLKVNYDNIPQDDYKFQNIRFGLSYTYYPNLNKIFNLHPLSLMVAMDAVFKGSNYKFTEWQPNFGIELKLLEILELSFGKENELQIKDKYPYSPQYPVSRYGFGINVPFSEIFNTANKIKLKLDYSISDWMRINEDKALLLYFGEKSKIDKYAISIGLSVEF